MARCIYGYLNTGVTQYTLSIALSDWQKEACETLYNGVCVHTSVWLIEKEGLK